MLKPQFSVEIVEESAHKGVYIISPLPRGFGHTMGNSLRRVLLSSLVGDAVTHVKIKGVSHPFGIVKGVKEDVIELLLNIKQLRFVSDSEEEHVIKLSKKGEGKVYASDLQDSPLCKVLNKDLVLCELSSKGAIEAELYVSKGTGYEPASRKEDKGFEVLPVDSLYSPIVSVNLLVESTRINRLTNYDKLTINIETDGSMTGRQALDKASSLMVEYFTLLGTGGLEKKQEESQSGQRAPGMQSSDVMVDELDLPTRVINALVKNNIETVKQLRELSDEDFSKIRGLGKKSVEELKAKLENLQS